LGVAVAAGAALAGDSSTAQTLEYSVRQPLNGTDAQLLRSALEASRLGDAPRIRSAMDQLSDPLARKVALWALIETNPDGMSYAELDGARRDLAGWPGAAHREAATEKVLEGGGLSPQGIIDWFAGADPTTAEGAMALASAYQATGQAPKGADAIRKVWRTHPFDAAVQQQVLARFGAVLTEDDDAAREDMLLYGSQGQAARDLIPLLSPDQQALAQARMAIRSGGGSAASVPASLRDSPGLAYELALAAERRGDSSAALALLPRLANALPDEESQARMWKLRKPLLIAAIQAGDVQGAYRAAANTGIDRGADGAEAEFYAGWLALTKMHDPRLADDHFARLQAIGASPITLSRAFYWRGRAAEAEGDVVNAQIFYAGGARYQTAFYGQLAAAKAGITTITLGTDPVITAADRARFEDREPIRAARLMEEIGAKDSFAAFVLQLAATLPSASEAAQLVDLTRGYGEQFLSMKVVRIAAQHGYTLPIRGYPLRTPPAVAGAPEPAFVLGITRQESGFDPGVHSGAGAQGMMQLMPGTAAIIARRLGYSYGPGRLLDADYNMTLGSSFLGQLVSHFDGSYVMAAAAYNAGPGRPTQWSAICGDPRSANTDPTDFIECIPFTETHDYVMRVLEATEVYRARLAGGSARLNIVADLRRGGYGGYTAGPAQPPPPAASPDVSGTR
jgi:soluble lytic murein transglycosylase